MIEQSANKRNSIMITDLEAFVSENHLVRKMGGVVGFKGIYKIVEPYYCEDNGRPAVDPIVLVKIILIQHLFGLASLRKTIAEIAVHVVYHWFLDFDLSTPMPQFATVSYDSLKRLCGRDFIT